MDEKRKASRRRVLKSATIEFDRGAYSCAVRNLSDNGASLDVPGAPALPKEFVLVLETSDVRKQCHIIWCKENRLGIDSTGAGASTALIGFAERPPSGGLFVGLQLFCRSTSAELTRHSSLIVSMRSTLRGTVT
jgi:hypothetical protein